MHCRCLFKGKEYEACVDDFIHGREYKAFVHGIVDSKEYEEMKLRSMNPFLVFVLVLKEVAIPSLIRSVQFVSTSMNTLLR